MLSASAETSSLPPLTSAMPLTSAGVSILPAAAPSLTIQARIVLSLDDENTFALSSEKRSPVIAPVWPASV
jgi:hypothetical protein